MIEIKLTKDKVTTVPDAVAAFLNKDKWNANKCGNTYYAVRAAKKHEKIDGKYRKILMHRVIWEYFNGPIPKGEEIDHTDGNGLNNFENLKCGPHSDNMKNKRKQKNNTSGCEGVYEIQTWREGSNGCRWYVQNIVNGKKVYRGSFHDYSEACAVADFYRKQYLGEFMRKPHEVVV